MDSNKNNETLDKGRKLSEAELRRKEKLEQLTEQLTSEGYSRKDLTISMFSANVKGPLLALPFLVVEIMIHRAVCGSLFGTDWGRLSWTWWGIALALVYSWYH